MQRLPNARFKDNLGSPGFEMNSGNANCVAAIYRTSAIPRLHSIEAPQGAYRFLIM